ncbi:aldehyde dehydrogenase (NADP(+)) [Streptomyces canus]|uniref:aldehyde dehydrogenase (NADP(+)) n=1 Tax=Streptomyces canus TaxID=58343 RepID=UPI003817D942
MNETWSIDARTGERLASVAHDTSVADTDRIAQVAARAATELRATDRSSRSALLRAVATALDVRGDKLIDLADHETALGPARLQGELARTTGQLRFLADAVEAGDYQEATFTEADPTAIPPVPELRRMLIALGPVLVFGAGNFPIAFSVLGGDTASALAAGCPVVFKVHPGHPATSMLALEAWRDACTELGQSERWLQPVFGHEAARLLLQHPVIKAVAFTGSLAVGRELHDLAARRAEPIPFYGELSGVNPLLVTTQAAAERAESIGHGIATSVTQGAGQFCTKPGLVFVPDGADGDRLVQTIAADIAALPALSMLNSSTQSNFTAALQELSARTIVVAGADPGKPEGAVGATLLQTSITEFDPAMQIECFGPSSLVVRYRDVEQVLALLPTLEGGLAAAIHAADAEVELVQAFTDAVLPRVGRVVYNGYPTGVTVSAAMTHGGPWPATTNALHSSIGPGAIRRFLRPVTFQNAPAPVLPADLRIPA